MRKQILRVLGVCGFLLMALPWIASAAGPLPYSFTQGTVADADQVNANFQNLLDAANSAEARLDALEQGPVSPGFGDASGIQFPDNPGGGSGDGAWIKYYSDGGGGGGENLALQIGIANDANDDIEFQQSGAVRMSIENGDVNVTQDLSVDGILQLTPQDLPTACSQTGAVYFSSQLAEPCFCDGSNWRQFDGGGNC